MEVTHDKEGNRFLISMDGEDAFIEYGQSDGMIELHHTEVPEAHEGKGVGSALAREALDYARKNGLRVIATCPFVEGFVKKNRPEYDDIVEEN